MQREEETFLHNILKETFEVFAFFLYGNQFYPPLLLSVPVPYYVNLTFNWTLFSHFYFAFLSWQILRCWKCWKFSNVFHPHIFFEILLDTFVRLNAMYFCMFVIDIHTFSIWYLEQFWFLVVQFAKGCLFLWQNLSNQPFCFVFAKHREPSFVKKCIFPWYFDNSSYFYNW